MLYLAVAGFALFVLFLWYRKRSYRSISYLPVPPTNSWLVGNLPSLQRPDNAGEIDFEWTKEYGTAFRIKGCFGDDVLYLSDPKALQYVFNKNGYNYPRSWENAARTWLATGPGITAVEGAQHVRHRRVMVPSFSHASLRGFLPLFFRLAQKAVVVWKAKIHRQGSKESVLNVSSLLANIALDAIGEAAFGHKFDAIDGVDPPTELHKAYKNLFNDVAYMPSDRTIIFLRLLGSVPRWTFNVLTSIPKKDLKRLREYRKVSRKVAKDVVDKEVQAQASGKEAGKNVMSIVIKANQAEDPKRRLLEEEILPQVTTLMLAGHETTANTLSWALYELSKNPEAQHKLRAEIRATRATIASRGDTEITMQDMDTMKYTIAVMKETMRYHPVVPHMARRAGSDDVIPLGKPQKTASGEEVSSIPVRQDQVVYLSMVAYNRLQDVWGKDAHRWRPERFLEEIESDYKTNLGVYGNLATFGSGVRSCIGWRFAVLEFQAVLIEIIDHFEFRPAPGVEIKRSVSGLMQAMVRGKEHEGTQMPLRVSLARESDEN